MVWQTSWLLLHRNPPEGLEAFVFFSTICSYNFHWYLTPSSIASSQRIGWAQQFKGYHLFLYFAGLAGAVFFFIPIRSYWPALAVGAFVTFLYSAPKIPQSFFRGLKKIAIGKTIFLSLVWTYVTALLPILLSGATWEARFTLFALSRFFLIYAICILFDYRDREDDKQDGIKSLITYFSEAGINRLFFFSLFLFALATIMLYPYTQSPLPIANLLLPGLILALLYPLSKRNFSDYLYYFILDGLMMFSGLLTLVSRI